MQGVQALNRPSSAGFQFLLLSHITYSQIPFAPYIALPNSLYLGPKALNPNPKPKPLEVDHDEWREETGALMVVANMHARTWTAEVDC